ncbi:MAG: S8 family serine peptidase [Dehalococcoidales bacterium]|nr:S8 family serine peptidase [Dehalococcoidales bacterium]
MKRTGMTRFISVVAAIVVFALLMADCSRPVSAFADKDDFTEGGKASSLLSLRIKLKSRALAYPGEIAFIRSSLSGSGMSAAGQDYMDYEKVFIYFKQYPAIDQINDLESQGVTVYPDSWVPPVGNHPCGFILADMPVDKLDVLSAKSYIVRMDTAEKESQPMNDLARIEAGVDSVWSGGETGEGVTVAVLDSGIDTSNADFPVLDAANSRDYSDYPSLDYNVTNTVTGHGTHVAGSLLGRGVNGTDYKGMAPDADLVFLKIGSDADGSASVASEAAAIRDAVDVYHARIISLSYGSWGQYHDGSEQDCQAVDYAVSQGASVFVSAGNEADMGWHYSGTVGANSTSGYIRVNINSGTSPLSMNLVWFDGLNIRRDLSLQYYNSHHDLLESIEGSQSESPRGTESLMSQLDSQGDSGTYYLKVRNDSSSNQFFHIYIRGGKNAVTFHEPDPDYTLCSPADADSAIAVGALTTRNSWKDYMGLTHTSAAAVGEIANFSSRGPRVDEAGVSKPNMVAPGQRIISVRDDAVYPWPEYNTGADIYPYATRIIDNDGQDLDGSGPADYLVLQGTSMACPIAAGVAALVLGKNPDFTPAQLRHALEATAVDEGEAGRDNVYGWGLVDAAAAVGAGVTMASYSDKAYSIVCNNFSDILTEHTAYIRGSDYLPGHDYQVVYYDGDDIKVATDLVTSDNAGNLYSHHDFMQGTDSSGTWHASVAGTESTLSGEYDPDSPYIIASCTFTVQDTAIALPGPVVVSTIKLGSGGINPAAVGVNISTGRVYITNISSNNVCVIDGATGSGEATVDVGFWPQGIAVNSVTGFIYVSNLGYDNVSVIDGASNAVIETINVGDFPARMGVNETTNRIYVANNSSNTVSVIDGESNTVADIVTVGDAPCGIGVNPSTNRIYVSNDGSDSVSVIDGYSNIVIGTIPVGKEPGGIDVNALTNRIYVTNYGDNSITVIDGDDNSIVDTLDVGENPRGVAVNPDPEHNLVYVANFGSDTVSVINGADNSPLTTIDTGKQPFGVAVNIAENLVYVSNYGSSTVSVIDGTSNAVIDTINTASGPDALDIDPDSDRIYAAGTLSNRVSVIDGSSGNILTEVNVGNKPMGMVMNTAAGRIYVTNSQDNTVSVIDAENDTVMDAVDVGSQPWGIALNRTTGYIYVPNYLDDSLSIINVNTGEVEKTVNTGSFPQGVAVNEAANRVYVTNSGSNNLTVLDGYSHEVIKTVNVGLKPFGVAVNPDTSRVYVTNNGVNTVSVINGDSNVVVDTVPVGSSPRGIAVNPLTNRIFVANNGADTVSIIDGYTNDVEGSVNVGKKPRGLVVDPQTNRIYVTNYSGDSLTVIQDATFSQASRLGFSQQPGTENTAGVNFGTQPSITVEDIVGNVVADSSDPVTLSITPGSGTSGATLCGTTTMNAVDGMAVFTDLSIDKAGTGYTLTASSGALTQAISSPFDVIQADTRTEITISLESSGSLFACGQPVTFTAAVSPAEPNGVIPAGTVSFEEDSEVLGTDILDETGRADFTTPDLSLGVHNITAVYSGDDNFLPGTSDILEITIGPAARYGLVWGTQPPDTAIAGDIWPLFTVEIVDRYGNRTSDTDIITIVPSSDTLEGTLSRAAADGIASFTDIARTKAGELTLIASSGDLVETPESILLTVDPAAASQVRVETSGDGGGGVVPAQEIKKGRELTVYGITRDQYGNFTGNPESTTWNITELTGGVAVSDLSAETGASVTFEANETGSGIIHASIDGLASIDSGIITVVKSSSGGGGGGGGGGGSSTIAVYLNGLTSTSSLRIDSRGVVQSTAVLKTPDGRVEVDISGGTKILTSLGTYLSTLKAESLEAPPPPEEGTLIITAYTFGPDGAQFDPPVLLSMAYDQDEFPVNVAEEDLYIAYYDGTAWQGLEGVVDFENKMVKAPVTHFSSFALTAGMENPPASTPVSPTPVSTPGPAETIIPPPTRTLVPLLPEITREPAPSAVAATTPTPAESTGETVTATAEFSPSSAPVQTDEKTPPWLIIVIGVCALAVVITVIIVAIRSRNNRIG